MRNMNIKSIQQWLSRAGELVNEFATPPIGQRSLAPSVTKMICS